MARYRIDYGNRDCVTDCVTDAVALEYAMETLLDDGAEPGEEAAVYRIDDEDRGVEEHVGTVVVPGEDD